LNTYFLPKYGSSAPATALYTLWGGANDINHALGPNPTTAIAAGKAAADNIENEIMAIHTAGGQYFLWLNLPPLGETPGAMANGAGVVAEANAASAAFNAEYEVDLQALIAQGIDVIPVDISTLFGEILLDPSAFGFNDITDGCISTSDYTSVNPCTSTTNPNQYLFWDDEHPTTAGDALVAQAAYNALLAAPEPATYALLLLGACGLVAFRRRRSKI
jgi:phospholipase/lecithinase/hemolysin